MILVFDIGNTNIKTAVFDDEKTDGESVLLHVWRISTDIRRTGDEYFSILSPLFKDAKIDCQTIEDIVLSSVVPALIGPDMYDKLPVKVPALLLILAQPFPLLLLIKMETLPGLQLHPVLGLLLILFLIIQLRFLPFRWKYHQPVLVKILRL